MSGWQKIGLAISILWLIGWCRPECGWNLRGAISGDMSLSDC
jgi:hypothetical protein